MRKSLLLKIPLYRVFVRQVEGDDHGVHVGGLGVEEPVAAAVPVLCQDGLVDEGVDGRMCMSMLPSSVLWRIASFSGMTSKTALSM